MDVLLDGFCLSERRRTLLILLKIERVDYDGLVGYLLGREKEGVSIITFLLVVCVMYYFIFLMSWPLGEEEGEEEIIVVTFQNTG